MSAADVVGVILVKIVLMLGFLLHHGRGRHLGRPAAERDGAGPRRAQPRRGEPAGNAARVIVLLPPTRSTSRRAFACSPRCPARPRTRRSASPARLRRRRSRRNAFEVLTYSTQLAVLVRLAQPSPSSPARSAGARALSALEGALVDVDPRSVFYAGVALHARSASRSPPSSPPTSWWTPRAAPAPLLALLLFVAGVYTASRVPGAPSPSASPGLVHSVADVLKLVMKEDFVPRNADRLLHSLAPMISLFPAFVTMAVLPFGPSLCVGERPPAWPSSRFSSRHVAHAIPTHAWACPSHTIGLQVADLNVGILYMFAMGGTGVVGAALAGWASDNKFSLLGGLRAASQMVSYEVAMGLSLVGISSSSTAPCA